MLLMGRNYDTPKESVSGTGKMVLQPHLSPPPTVLPPPPTVSPSFTSCLYIRFFSQIFFSEWNSVDNVIKWLKPANFLNIFGRQDHCNFTPPPPIVSPPPPTVSPQKYVFFGSSGLILEITSKQKKNWNSTLDHLEQLL